MTQLTDFTRLLSIISQLLSTTSIAGPMADASMTQSTRSAALARSRARRTPSCSTGSPLSRIRRCRATYRIAVEIEMDLDHVARGAGIRRHDRRLAPRQPIEQCRFSRIGRPAMATTRPSRNVRRGRRRPILLQSRCAIAAQHKAPADQILRHIGLVGKIDPRFDKGQRLDNFRRHASARSPIKPLSWRNACRRCAAVSAAMRSANHELVQAGHMPEQGTLAVFRSTPTWLTQDSTTASSDSRRSLRLMSC